MVKAKVLFEYIPQEDDELGLQVGDIILEVEPADTGWCKGLLNGKRGMFPDNFVQIMESDDKKAPHPPSAQKKPSKKYKKVKVCFAYDADNEDELSMKIGDIIEILKDVEEGWAEGRCKGKVGVFPTNFVEPLPDSSESEESGDGGIDAKLEATKEDEEVLATSSQKKVKGVGFGNIFGDGPIKLRQRSIGEADKKKNLSTSASKPVKESTPAKVIKEKDSTKDLHSSASASKPKKNVEYCRVMFDYGKDNDDELDLCKGEIIVVIDKNGGDEGWWEGERTQDNGKKIRGVFPDNFVILLTAEETREHERLLQAKNEPDSSRDAKFAKSPSSAKDKVSVAKKSAPIVPQPPSQGVKPSVVHSDSNHAELEDSFAESATAEHTLNHMKRPAGPKNRRKPGAAERREKAQAAESLELNGEVAESDEDKLNKAEHGDHPVAAPKKDSMKRGVAVLPGPSEAGSGETPSWLQNLKNRQSHKRPPPAVTPAPGPTQKEASPSETKPNWLQNLKKRQSSEFPPPAPRPKSPERPVTQVKKPPPQPAKPPEKALQPPKPEKVSPPNTVPPSVPPAVAKPPQKPVAPPSEKPLAAWQVERQQKKKTKTTESGDEPAPEPPSSTTGVEPVTSPSWRSTVPKKSPIAHVAKPTEPVHAMPPKKDKPPVGTPITAPIAPKVKPAPPKGKPLPAVKPASSTVVEELKEELRDVREQMEKMREEMKKEILKLNQELQDEKKQRVALQSEVSKLRQHLPS